MADEEILNGSVAVKGKFDFSADDCSEAWLDSRLQIRASAIHGLGMITDAVINAGEVVLVLGGRLVTIADVEMGRVKPNSTSGFTEGFYLGRLWTDPDCSDQFLNHSCDANLWLMDQVTLAAREKIEAGQELTVDYSIWEIDDKWSLGTTCRCESVLCRETVKGCDWKLPQVQRLYQGHFLPCLERRIQLALSKEEHQRM